jgi:murein DD-endopeptidase MepM/ murein hydrolase activator NlpD
MTAWEWIFLAGAAAGAGYLLFGREPAMQERLMPGPFQMLRIWPLPAMPDGRKPVISSAHRNENPARRSHRGVDIMYPRRRVDHQEIGDGAGARRFVMPANTPIVATERGVVQIAGKIGTGWRVWVVHGAYRTGYFHLRELAVATGQVVRLGMRLGTVGHDPSASDPLHLHFELSPADTYAPQNPGPYLRGAQVLADSSRDLWISPPMV